MRGIWKMNTECMFSGKTDDWSTPIEFFKILDNEFHFELDPCADKENHKCKKYFTAQENGLLQPWGSIACSAIRHMGEKLEDGLKRLITQIKNMATLLLCYCQRVQIQNGFTIISIIVQKYVLFVED